MIGGYFAEFYDKPEELLERVDLSEREMRLIKMSLGLTGDGQVKSKEQIAVVFGISPDSVSKRQKNILNKVKRKILQEKFPDYWESDKPVTVHNKHYLWKNTIYLQIDLKDSINPESIKEKLMPILESNGVKEWKWKSK
jgi:hypothetical protein